MNDDIYKEIIMENYKEPKNLGTIKDADYTSHETNPTCGDEIEVFIKESNGKVDDVKFEGCGCAISIASASLFTEEIKGKKLSDVKKMSEKDVIKALGIELSHSRVKCASLILVAVKHAISRT